MLIGICGKARSGKDTVAGHLVREYGFHQASFAAPLKKICADIFNLSPEQIHGDFKEVVDSRYGKTPRQILQHIGTEGFRAVYAEVWAEYLIRAQRRSGLDTVVSDVRFKNEVSAIRRAGGHLWRLRRIGYEGLQDEEAAHASETEMDSMGDWNFDMIASVKCGETRRLTDEADYFMERFPAEVRNGR